MDEARDDAVGTLDQAKRKELYFKVQDNPNLKPEDVIRNRRNLRLDDPLYIQYWNWISGLVHGDFGRTLVDGSPVIKHILERLPNTLELTLTGIALGILISIPLGVVGAL